MKIGNVDHLQPWQIKALAVRYEGMADDTHTYVDNQQRAFWRNIAEALRNHPRHPRS